MSRCIEKRLQGGGGNCWTSSAAVVCLCFLFALSACYTTKLNHREIVDGVHRTRQMSPEKLQSFVEKHEIRTVLNLRGNNEGSEWYDRQERILAELGVVHMSIALRGKAFPEKEAVLELVRFFERAERPMLIHCRDGADRTGMASAVYLHEVEGMYMRKAMKELSVAHGHLSNQLDFLLVHYARYTGELGFEEWIDRHYDKRLFEKMYERSLKPHYLLSRSLFAIKGYLP